MVKCFGFKVWGRNTFADGHPGKETLVYYIYSRNNSLKGIQSEQEFVPAKIRASHSIFAGPARIWLPYQAADLPLSVHLRQYILLHRNNSIKNTYYNMSQKLIVSLNCHVTSTI